MEKTSVTMAVILICLYFTLTIASPTNLQPDDSLCDSTLEDQNLPHQLDCSKYYRCVYGKKVPKECPEKMLFNPQIGNCDLYYNVDCAFETSAADDDDQEDQNLIEAIDSLTGRNFVRNPKIFDATSKESSHNSVEKNTRVPTESTTMKFVYLPHDTDPNAYYKIQNGEKLLLYCEEDKVFSFDLEICLRPWDFK